MVDNAKLKRGVKGALRNLHPSLVGLWAKDITGIRHRPASPLVHLRETMGWLRTAHEACGNQGVSGGYSLVDGWLPPYPETTGYIIPTFYDYANLTGEQEWRDRAWAMAKWETSVQMASGAVQAGLFKGLDATRRPAVFNTGQVILGWCRAYTETGDKTFLEAAVRAGEWLLRMQDIDGAWRVSSSETETTVHTYDVRTAWALLEIFVITSESRFLESANLHLDWTLTQQRENGWFDNNAFFESRSKWRNPFTHTIAYVMEGLQESYRILHDRRYLEAYAKTAERLMRQFELRRYMPGDLDHDWKPSEQYSCLTGNAQIAAVWIKHFKLTDDLRYLNAALKLNDYNRSTQYTRSMHKGIRGGVKGSHPIRGNYTPFIYPNWAAKFFADSLMLEEEVMKEFELRALREGTVGNQESR